MPSWNSRGLRGSMLEEALNMTNEQYRKEHLALVQKYRRPLRRSISTKSIGISP